MSYFDPDNTARQWNDGTASSMHNPSRPGTTMTHYSVSEAGPEIVVSNAELASMFRSYFSDMNSRMDVLDNRSNDLETLIREAYNRNEELFKEVNEVRAAQLIDRTHIDRIERYVTAVHTDTQSTISALGQIQTDIRSLRNATPPTTTTIVPPPVPPRLAHTTTGTTTAPAPATGSGSSIKLAKPDKYNGKKKEKATDFRIACTQYLRATAPSASEYQKVMFIVSYLEGTASEWLRPYNERDLIVPVPFLHDTNLFWQEFEKRFGEVDKTGVYRKKLRSLKQTGSVQDYLRDFQTYAGPLGYGDNAIRDMFYDNLATYIMEAMLAQMFDPNQHTFEEVATRALEIDQRSEAFKSRPSASKSSSKPTTQPTAPNRDRCSRGPRLGCRLGAGGSCDYCTYLVDIICSTITACAAVSGVSTVVTTVGTYKSVLCALGSFRTINTQTRAAKRDP